EILQRTHKVQVAKAHRIKLEADGVQFVVALIKSPEDEERPAKSRKKTEEPEDDELPEDGVPF
ncbi:MAG: hypothetical protein GWN12_13240, partial [Thermoplasmata archaeon]|nr:hypothetical protein [Thermoplasmata archaeon]NIV39592.1 hypothetical protein [Anaerolineae bacterium]NIS12987.1 hypothetical protein [Thermoplasmata archaeon]NIT78316.1 hypothetical protein [Thermoplasmata archaeon]NIW89705.1 hypothetical protein [Thermoplasmata archaeon]